MQNNLVTLYSLTIAIFIGWYIPGYLHVTRNGGFLDFPCCVISVRGGKCEIWNWSSLWYSSLAWLLRLVQKKTLKESHLEVILLVLNSIHLYICVIFINWIMKSWCEIRPKKKYVCLRSPNQPYFSAADPNLFYRQLFDPNFC